jgi:nucleoside-diphosphate-sugar epimerase
MKILVTGGAGYIGSITATALEERGHTPIIVDSLLSGPGIFTRDRIFYEGDIADRELIDKIISEHPDIECTIHMAATVVVPESVALPYEYYRDNVAKSLELFDQLVHLHKPRIIFSSSASVYAPTKDFEALRVHRSIRSRRMRVPSTSWKWCWRTWQRAPIYGRSSWIFQSDRVGSPAALRRLCASSDTRPWSNCDGSPRATGGIPGHRY